MKKLYRSKNNKMVSGVCAGFAEFYNVDPTIIRLGVAGVVLFSGFFPGALVYFVCAIIMPLEPNGAIVDYEDTVVVEPRMESVSEEETTDDNEDDIVVEAKLNNHENRINLEK